MAAVATAIRLAILKSRVSSMTPQAIKVLVLDDIMISLDMSNRDRLMDLILADYAQDYQILFLTHDKGLYHFVHHKITQHSSLADWKVKEMYVGECDTTKQEYPVIIDGKCEPFIKAKKFFATKDYTSSALYIRQALEKIVSEALPEELKKRADNKFVELDTMWKRLLKYNQNIPEDIQKMFSQSKLILLNPLVHYQKLSQPIYKRELLAAFTLVDRLLTTDTTVKTLLIDKGNKATFRHPSANYTFEFEFDQDMIKGDQENPNCKIIRWQYNGVDFFDFNSSALLNNSNVLTSRFLKIKSNLELLPLGIDENCFLDNTVIECGTLREALI